MNQQIVNNLKEALAVSPNNIPLRLLLADNLSQMKELDTAIDEYNNVLKLDNDNKEAQLGLAGIFYKKGAYAQCIVILEGSIETNSNLDAQILYTRALLKKGEINNAIDSYKRVISLNPGFRDDELDAELRIQNTTSQEEETDEDDIIERPSISFDDVGGMNDVKKEIELKIIQPLLHPDIYKAYGKKVGGGILLYGPPGCGKTYLAKATAGQVKTKFISVGLNDILDMWMGNSEKKLNEIFEVARTNTPCILFFDEIDALGASRNDLKQSSGKNIINQFLQELDGINANNEGILIVGATNTPWHLDTAFRRPGRFDRIIFVAPPDEDARKSIFKIKLKDKPTDNIDYQKLANKTKKYSGADIEAIIDIAIENKLEQAISSGTAMPLNTKDLLSSIKKHNASTTEWFTTAKNFALYANESGLYNDILDYLKIK